MLQLQLEIVTIIYATVLFLIDFIALIEFWIDWNPALQYYATQWLV